MQQDSPPSPQTPEAALQYQVEQLRKGYPVGVSADELGTVLQQLPWLVAPLLQDGYKVRLEVAKDGAMYNCRILAERT